MNLSTIRNLAFLICLLPFGLQAQVGISENGADPDPSSILDVQSTDKGILIPRMTDLERDAILNPANGGDPYTQTRSGIVSLSPFAVFGANASILIVEAGDPQSICQSKAVDLTTIGASITPANFAGTWTTSGEGTVDDTNTGMGVFGVAMTYSLGNADIQNGEVYLILESNGISDQAPITILRVNCGSFPWDGN
ncbi:MAG: hypothetical protein IPJ40_01980 [Saprospirales bacterium]|nr:hypothetical protein [Saprospirales bacterium]